MFVLTARKAPVRHQTRDLDAAAGFCRFEPPSLDITDKTGTSDTI